jgi:hypothetical protein
MPMEPGDPSHALESRLTLPMPMERRVTLPMLWSAG